MNGLGFLTSTITTMSSNIQQVLQQLQALAETIVHGTQEDRD